MNAREWVAGDVAVIGTMRAFYIEPGRWQYADGFASQPAQIAPEHGPRQLVVIDAEDADQVGALFQKWWNNALGAEGGVARMQAALREFANPTPPKPDEPTGLGAVVEACDESVWSRRADGQWHCLTGDPDLELLVKWQHFEAPVAVLSEGVQP